MCLPAAIARLTAPTRTLVADASKKISYRGSDSVESRSVLQRSTPYLAASSRSFSSFLPTRIGSGNSRPSPRRSPPSLRISAIERSRCWLVPIRPVTPNMMMPTRRAAFSDSDLLARISMYDSNSSWCLLPRNDPAIRFTANLERIALRGLVDAHGVCPWLEVHRGSGRNRHGIDRLGTLRGTTSKRGVPPRQGEEAQ